MDSLDDEGRALVRKYMPLAKAIARRFARHLPDGVDYDDVKSEAYLALCESAARFDDTRGVDFSVYARPRIAGAIIDYLNPHIRVRRRKINFLLIPCPTDGHEQVEDRIMLDEFFRVLPRHLKLVAKLRLIDGLNFPECAEILGCTKGHVYRLWVQVDIRIQKFAA